jgi:hypothetical protein
MDRPGAQTARKEIGNALPMRPRLVNPYRPRWIARGFATKRSLGKGKVDQMRMFRTSARRRPVALAVLVLALAAFGASAASAAPPPPPVLKHPPPITPNFALHPDHGPIGTQVTVQGICGSFRPEILYAVGVKGGPTGFQTIWLPPNFATASPSPVGSFQFTFAFPAAGNFGTTDPLGPGAYLVGVACNGPPHTIFLGAQPFTVTASD